MKTVNSNLQKVFGFLGYALLGLGLIAGLLRVSPALAIGVLVALYTIIRLQQLKLVHQANHTKPNTNENSDSKDGQSEAPAVNLIDNPPAGFRIVIAILGSLVTVNIVYWLGFGIAWALNLPSYASF